MKTRSKPSQRLCCVCVKAGSYTSANPLLTCASCSATVHKECYGVGDIPEENWVCQPCGLKEEPNDLNCELCPNVGGVFKKSDRGGWAHVICALMCIPEVKIGNDSAKMEIIMTSTVPRDRFNLTCYVCKRVNEGACIQCSATTNQCSRNFHVTCGQQRGLLIELRDQAGCVSFYGHCHFHGKHVNSRRGQRKLPKYCSNTLVPASPQAVNTKKGVADDGDKNEPDSPLKTPVGSEPRNSEGIIKHQSVLSNSDGCVTSRNNNDEVIAGPKASLAKTKQEAKLTPVTSCNERDVAKETTDLSRESENNQGTGKQSAHLQVTISQFVSTTSRKADPKRKMSGEQIQSVKMARLDGETLDTEIVNEVVKTPRNPVTEELNQAFTFDDLLILDKEYSSMISENSLKLSQEPGPVVRDAVDTLTSENISSNNTLSICKRPGFYENDAEIPSNEITTNGSSPSSNTCTFEDTTDMVDLPGELLTVLLESTSAAGGESDDAAGHFTAQSKSVIVSETHEKVENGNSAGTVAESWPNANQLELDVLNFCSTIQFVSIAGISEYDRPVSMENHNLSSAIRNDRRNVLDYLLQCQNGPEFTAFDTQNWKGRSIPSIVNAKSLFFKGEL